MRIKTLTALLLICPGFVAAQGVETQCTNQDLVRRVVIMSEPGVSVPCEVHYFKDTEAPGEDQVLWSANQQAGFCEEKASELIARLEGWGWSCGTDSAAAPAAPEAAPAPPEPAEVPEEPEEPVDMTEDLAPVPQDDAD